MDAGAVLHLRAAAPPQRRQGPGQQNIFIKPQNYFLKKYFPCAAWRGAEVAGLAAGEDPGAEADTGERGSGQEVAHTQPRAGEREISATQFYISVYILLALLANAFACWQRSSLKNSFKPVNEQ